MLHMDHISHSQKRIRKRQYIVQEKKAIQPAPQPFDWETVPESFQCSSTAKPEPSTKPNDTVGEIYSRPCYPCPRAAKFAHMGPQMLILSKKEKYGKRKQDAAHKELQQ